ncbi:nucleotide-diphospho-sugar transferase [Stachybotrys elegans]|uniref:Nucleotide-diphospho-sugar transferase n=1 Tax=Stachybotrys elegans TaxID=80388 RepID=A0A8K0SHL2_9HYPO|nr:nucleotide-diphospho-sugar transferase [Stachybotrys elegans]
MSNGAEKKIAPYPWALDHPKRADNAEADRLVEADGRGITRTFIPEKGHMERGMSAYGMLSWLLEASNVLFPPPRAALLLTVLAGFITVLILHHAWLDLSAWSTDEPLETVSPNAYVFYATEENYACSVAVNLYMLRHVFNTPHQLIVLVSDGVTAEYNNIFSDLGAKVIPLTPPPLHPSSVLYYEGCLLKLLAFKLHLLDPTVKRALVLDSDQLILHSPDSAFRLPSTPFTAAPAYWISNRTLTSACMLIEPSEALWQPMDAALTSIKPDKYDMDVINELYGDIEDPMPGNFLALNSHWEDKNVPAWFESDRDVAFPEDATSRPADDYELEQLYKQTAIVHFTAVGKPWLASIGKVREERPEANRLLITQWAKWRVAASEICPRSVIDVL